MQKLLLIFALLSTIFLSGCQTRPDELIQTQRFVAFKFVEINGKKYVDLDESLCLKREYKYSLHFLGPLNKFRNVPFEECDKTTGYGPVDYTNVTLFLDEIRKEIETHE